MEGQSCSRQCRYPMIVAVPTGFPSDAPRYCASASSPEEIELLDLTGGGCRFRCKAKLPLLARVSIGIAGVGHNLATIAWADETSYGCAFDRPIPNQAVTADAPDNVAKILTRTTRAAVRIRRRPQRRRTPSDPAARRGHFRADRRPLGTHHRWGTGALRALQLRAENLRFGWSRVRSVSAGQSRSGVRRKALGLHPARNATLSGKPGAPALECKADLLPCPLSAEARQHHHQRSDRRDGDPPGKTIAGQQLAITLVEVDRHLGPVLEAAAPAGGGSLMVQHARTGANPSRVPWRAPRRNHSISSA